ncbi:macrophage colony-stimulating factor 1 isoform X1 [Nycticebus coucang]|uniref:macrophage colony-stimulating factor 1 isoform X1 n=1 Tax=Nycticebus coucang TaxID=9470 RepID=UPI00234CC474|nr:macrophage colony-stimulating factor 1 isoform X1 [Nycticebus coucang]XP_053447827.1 macrophage colony-stimulating factor 1 isoform X1 [Nycticebus coucang]
MTAPGAAGRCPPTTWLGRLLLVCLLVRGSVTAGVSEHCSHMIGNGHLQSLQQLIDSQMETSCQIAFEFVDQEQLKDPVCYLKKAFLLVQDIMDDTMRFKDNTPSANAIVQLQELSLRLKSCFTKDYEEHDKGCVRTFNETPLQLLEKIKNVFNETKNLLTKDWNIFSKNCSNNFAKCSSQDMVTKPDCNCLYPKATPSSDLASVSPHQPLAPSMAPMAGLSWADSKGTEGNSLLPTEKPLRTVDPGSAKQRPPRSTCQSLELPETPGVQDSTSGDPPQSQPSVGTSTSGTEDILDSVLGLNWALEEASGEDGEGPPASRPEGHSVQAETARPSDLSAPSPLPASTKDQQPAGVDGTTLPKASPVRHTWAWNHTPEKTDGSSALPENPEELRSPRTSSLRHQGLSSLSMLPSQPRLPGTHFGDSVLPHGGLEGRRSTRDRRSPTELEGGGASERAAWPLARFNSVPLTDTGSERQPVGSSSPQLRGFAFRLLVPSIILVLLAVGGLLFYRRRRRNHQEPQTVDSPLEQPEGSPLTQDEDRQVELPV